jgi:phosphomannomutase
VLNLAGFQACDVRGVYGAGAEAEISPRHAFLIGQAIAARMPPEATAVVSGDGRASTPALLAALINGLNRPCVNLGTGVPTPLAYLAKQLHGAHASAIITASHNPAHCNGIKLQLGDLPITPAAMAAIRDEVAARDTATDAQPTAGQASSGTEALERVWDAYRVAVQQAFGTARGERIAVDCMHGCWAGRARELLNELGYRVEALRDERDGVFRGIDPDPSVDRNLEPLTTAVKNRGCAFGVALDGDGDRARFVDERGAAVDNGTALTLLVRYLVESKHTHGRRAVVYDQKTRLAVVQALRRCGVLPVMEKSGHTFIRTRMLKEGALFGGEKSGHFFWGGRDIYPVAAGDCGLFAAAAMGEALRFFGEPLSALAAQVPDSPFYTGDIRGLRYDGDRARLLATIADTLERTGYRVNREDGVRIETDDAFAQLRASVTESSMLTAAFDAADWDGLRRLADAVKSAMPADAEQVARGIEEKTARLKG